MCREGCGTLARSGHARDSRLLAPLETARVEESVRACVASPPGALRFGSSRGALRRDTGGTPPECLPDFFSTRNRMQRVLGMPMWLRSASAVLGTASRAPRCWTGRAGQQVGVTACRASTRARLNTHRHIAVNADVTVSGLRARRGTARRGASHCCLKHSGRERRFHRRGILFKDAMVSWKLAVMFHAFARVMARLVTLPAVELGGCLD